MILFGGEQRLVLSRFVNDTWEWDGAAWSLRSSAGSPAPRYDAAMASFDDRLILFGGYDGPNSYYSDTWEWNGQSWSQKGRQPEYREGVEPGNRYGSAMAGRGGRILLFGGFGFPPGRPHDEPTFLSDTWEWDGNSWLKKSVPSSPPARTGGMMTALGQKIILVGGRDSNGELNDMWQWDGTAWSSLPATPFARSRGAMGVVGDKLVMFGGYQNGYRGDTWEWDGQSWSQRLTATAPRARSGSFLLPMP